MDYAAGHCAKKAAKICGGINGSSRVAVDDDRHGLTPAAVSVIIVTFNSAHILERCLLSIPAECETIVVDNASADESVGIARRHAHIVIANADNGGFSAACNAAAAAASRRYLLFLNPDALLTPGAIEALLRASKRHPEAGAFNPVLVRAGDLANRPAQALDVELDKLSGAALFLRASTFQAMSGFDEQLFLYFEDEDLSRRLKETYGRLYAVHDSVVVHDAGNGARLNARQQYAKYRAYAASRSAFCAKYGENIRPAALAARQAGKALVRLLGGRRYDAAKLMGQAVGYAVGQPKKPVRSTHTVLPIRRTHTETIAEPRVGRPAVTILMTVYNGERFLKAQINSILTQSFADFELWIVDDGSADGSRRILQDYADADPRIGLIAHALNRGQKAALVTAFQRARGDLISFADQDDVWHEDKLARLVSAIDGRTAVYGSSHLIDDQGAPLGGTLLDHLSTTVSGHRNVKFLFKNSVSGHALLVRRNAIDPAMFALQRPYDWVIATLASFADGIDYVPEASTYHRMHDKNQCNNLTGPRRAQRASWKANSIGLIECLDALIGSGTLEEHDHRAFRNLRALLAQNVAQGGAASPRSYAFSHRVMALLNPLTVDGSDRVFLGRQLRSLSPKAVQIAHRVMTSLASPRGGVRRSAGASAEVEAEMWMQLGCT